MSRAALQDISQMLSNVYLLTETVGGKDGEDLDSAGVKVVDGAQLLLRTAEVILSSSLMYQISLYEKEGLAVPSSES